MKRHWIARNGSYGCLPDSSITCATKREAAETMAAIFDDVPGVKTALLRDEYLDLAERSCGADYAEIVPCDCADPGCHNDC